MGGFYCGLKYLSYIRSGITRLLLWPSDLFVKLDICKPLIKII
jgi:hypothetical protein